MLIDRSIKSVSQFFHGRIFGSLFFRSTRCFSAKFTAGDGYDDKGLVDRYRNIGIIAHIDAVCVSMYLYLGRVAEDYVRVG